MCKIIIALVAIASFLVLAGGDATPKKAGYGPGEQDWGWINVRKGGYMFYWLHFTSAKVSSPYDRPLVVWLQGGPGVSATSYGNFMDIGPLYPNGTAREYAWTKEVNVLFVDNPVGAGFSYDERNLTFARNNSQVGAEMVAFFIKFYQSYPKFEKTPLYLFGEEYGAKMAVEIAKQLDEAVKAMKVKANLKGVALGGPWISAKDSVVTRAPYLLHTGFIDAYWFDEIQTQANEVERCIDLEQNEKALFVWMQMDNDIANATSDIDIYNVMKRVPHERRKRRRSVLWDRNLGPEQSEELTKLMNGPVRKALGIPSNITHASQTEYVYYYLYQDLVRGVTEVVEDLLTNTTLDVVIYNGQLNLAWDSYGTQTWVNNLVWDGHEEWKTAMREPIVLDGFVEGYVAKVRRLHFYWITRAGHWVWDDTPAVAMDLLRRITRIR